MLGGFFVSLATLKSIGAFSVSDSCFITEWSKFDISFLRLSAIRHERSLDRFTHMPPRF